MRRISKVDVWEVVHNSRGGTWMGRDNMFHVKDDG